MGWSDSTCGYPIAIRAVTSEDRDDRRLGPASYDLIELVSSRIINEIPAVNRVVLDVTSNPRHDPVGVASAPPYRIETDRLVIRCYDPRDSAPSQEAVDASIEHLRPGCRGSASSADDRREG